MVAWPVDPVINASHHLLAHCRAVKVRRHVQELTSKMTRWVLMWNNMCRWNVRVQCLRSECHVTLTRVCFLLRLNGDTVPLCFHAQVTTRVLARQPFVDVGNVSQCRRATPATVSQDSNSALCRPTASVGNGSWRWYRRSGWTVSEEGGLGSSVYHHLSSSSSSSPSITQKLSEMKQAKLKVIRLFTLTSFSMPDNSVNTVQKAATVLWVLPSHIKGLAWTSVPNIWAQTHY